MRPARRLQRTSAGWRPCQRCRRPTLALHDVDVREARVGVEAGGGEERGADIAGEERVAAAAIRGRDPLCLCECVDGEASGVFEPALVAGAGERLQQREAVARRPVAETVAFLVL